MGTIVGSRVIDGKRGWNIKFDESETSDVHGPDMPDEFKNNYRLRAGDVISVWYAGGEQVLQHNILTVSPHQNPQKYGEDKVIYFTDTDKVYIARRNFGGEGLTEKERKKERNSAV